MKRFLAFLLCAVIGLGMASCSNEVVEKEYGPYSQVWRANDENVEHDTGDMSIDDGWGSVSDTASGALCRVTTSTLHDTAYTAAARLLVNEKTSTSKTVAAVRFRRAYDI